MLGKLLKQELKATARTLVPLYIGMIVIAIIGGVQLRWNVNKQFHNMGNVIDPMFNMNINMVGIAGFVLFGLTIAVVVLTALIVIQRFHRNLLEAEGYLTLTLPVTHTQLIVTKALVALFWTICSTVVIGLSWLAIIMPVMAVEELVNQLIYEWNYWIAGQITGSMVLSVVMFLLNNLVGLTALILSVYLAMMIGQMEEFHKFQLAVSVVAFVAIHWIWTIVTSPISKYMAFSMMDNINHIADMMLMSSIVGIVGGLVQIGLFFFGTKWIMDRKLNI